MPILPYRGIWPTIAPDAFIAPTAVIAGDVTVESGASVWFGAVLRGDAAPIRVGPRTNIQDNCVLHGDEGMPCVLGADCTLGHGAVEHGGAHAHQHAVVLGDDCIVAAAALVPEGKHFAGGELIVGVPGRVARAVTAPERERSLNGLRHYAEYAAEYGRALAELSASAQVSQASGGSEKA